MNYVSTESERVVAAFQRQLRAVNLTRAELSRRMDLGISTVGNWASGAKRPALSSMRDTIDALDEVLAELQEGVDQMRGILDLVDEAVQASLEKEASGAVTLELRRNLTAALDAALPPEGTDK